MSFLCSTIHTHRAFSHKNTYPLNINTQNTSFLYPAFVFSVSMCVCVCAYCAYMLCFPIFLSSYLLLYSVIEAIYINNTCFPLFYSMEYKVLQKLPLLLILLLLFLLLLLHFFLFVSCIINVSLLSFLNIFIRCYFAIVVW